MIKKEKKMNSIVIVCLVLIFGGVAVMLYYFDMLKSKSDKELSILRGKLSDIRKVVYSNIPKTEKVRDIIDIIDELYF